MERASLAARPPLEGDWSPEFGLRAAEWVRDKRDVTAVFTSNDQMALGLLRGLHLAGLRVPADVSLVGFDDIPEAAFFSPPLTTIRPDFTELGSQCVALLVDQLLGNEVDAGAPIVPALVVRESTAPRP